MNKIKKLFKKRQLGEVNNDYLRACAALGEKTHMINVILPAEIKRLSAEIESLRSEAEKIPTPSAQPVAETKEA